MVTGHMAVKRGAFILSAVRKVLASMHGASGCQGHERRVPSASPRPGGVHHAVDSSVLVQPLTLELLHTQPQCKGWLVVVWCLKATVWTQGEQRATRQERKESSALLVC